MYYCINTIIQSGGHSLNKWIFDPDKPIFRQICEKFRDEIARGNFPPGAKVPSVRDLAVFAGVNPNTVQRALSDLEDEGILVSRRGDGRYVADDATVRDKLLAARIRSACDDFIGAMRVLGLDDREIERSLGEALREKSDGKEG